MSDGITHHSQVPGGPRGTHFPNHPAFGPTSVVPVRVPLGLGEMRRRVGEDREMDYSDFLSLDHDVPLLFWSDASSGNGTHVPVIPGTGPPTQRTFVEAYRGSTGPIDFCFLPQPPPDHRMFNSSAPRGMSFSITLIFLDLGRSSQRYRVYATMPVRVLH
jgi:hypothetical protein